MATLDELDSRLTTVEASIEAIENSLSTLETNVHNMEATIQSTNSTLQSLNTTLTDLASKHTTDITTLTSQHQSDIEALDGRVTVLETWKTMVVDPTLDDHESRIYTLEYSHIKYTTTRSVKMPLKSGNGIILYVPMDLHMEDLMQLNQGIGSQVYHWYTKIFNPNGYGKVSFDLDRRDEGKIKTITVGQNARVLIPTGLKIKATPVKSSLKICNIATNAINNGLQFTIETVEGTDELIIGVSNPTTNVIDLKAGAPLVQLLHYFTYQSVPQLVSSAEFDTLDDNGNTP